MPVASVWLPAYDDLGVYFLDGASATAEGGRDLSLLALDTGTRRVIATNVTDYARLGAHDEFLPEKDEGVFFLERLPGEKAVSLKLLTDVSNPACKKSTKMRTHPTGSCGSTGRVILFSKGFHSHRRTLASLFTVRLKLSRGRPHRRNLLAPRTGSDRNISMRSRAILTPIRGFGESGI